MTGLGHNMYMSANLDPWDIDTPVHGRCGYGGLYKTLAKYFYFIGTTDCFNRRSLDIKSRALDLKGLSNSFLRLFFCSIDFSFRGHNFVIQGNNFCNSIGSLFNNKIISRSRENKNIFQCPIPASVVGWVVRRNSMSGIGRVGSALSSMRLTTLNNKITTEHCPIQLLFIQLELVSTTETLDAYIVFHGMRQWSCRSFGN